MTTILNFEIIEDHLGNFKFQKILDNNYKALQPYSLTQRLLIRDKTKLKL